MAVLFSRKLLEEAPHTRRRFEVEVAGDLFCCSLRVECVAQSSGAPVLLVGFDGLASVAFEFPVQASLAAATKLGNFFYSEGFLYALTYQLFCLADKVIGVFTANAGREMVVIANVLQDVHDVHQRSLGGPKPSLAIIECRIDCRAHLFADPSIRISNAITFPGQGGYGKSGCAAHVETKQQIFFAIALAGTFQKAVRFSAVSQQHRTDFAPGQAATGYFLLTFCPARDATVQQKIPVARLVMKMLANVRWQGSAHMANGAQAGNSLAARRPIDLEFVASLFLHLGNEYSTKKKDAQ